MAERPDLGRQPRRVVGADRVVVRDRPRAATIASIAACLARCHWPAGSAASWAANAVK